MTRKKVLARIITQKPKAHHNFVKGSIVTLDQDYLAAEGRGRREFRAFLESEPSVLGKDIT